MRDFEYWRYFRVRFNLGEYDLECLIEAEVEERIESEKPDTISGSASRGLSPSHDTAG